MQAQRYIGVFTAVLWTFVGVFMLINANDSIWRLVWGVVILLGVLRGYFVLRARGSASRESRD